MSDKKDAQRLDNALVTRSMVTSRNKAQQLIKVGKVRVNGKVISKTSTIVHFDDLVSLGDDIKQEDRYVSRAAGKLLSIFQPDFLEGLPIAIADALNPKDKVCLDIGASTGGFTEILLEKGAQKVVALDVGHGQLVEHLKADERVINLEGVNIRDFSVSDLPSDRLGGDRLGGDRLGGDRLGGEPQNGHLPGTALKSTPSINGAPFDLIVCDVSFISLTFVLPKIKETLKENGVAAVLLKPQFELGKEVMQRMPQGVVSDVELQEQAVQKVRDCAQNLGFAIISVTKSEVLGATGNQEFVMVIA